MKERKMFGMLKYIAFELKAKALQALEPDRQCEDVDLPMGAHIGALIRFGDDAFRLPEMCGSLISRPKAGESVIKSISRVKMGQATDFRSLRFYLATGDSDEGERFLQVFERGGKVLEMLYANSIYRLLPDKDQIRYYRGDLAKDGDGVGAPEWTFNDLAWLRSVLPKEVANRIPAETTEIVWKRESPGEGWVMPRQCVEDRIDDPHGDTGHKQTFYFSSYVRQLEGGQTNEYLVITLEVSPTRMHVDFMVGIPLLESDVQVIPTKG
jgi:hypothetical protein